MHIKKRPFTLYYSKNKIYILLYVFIKILKEIDFIERDNVLMCYHVLYCPTQRH